MFRIVSIISLTMILMSAPAQALVPGTDNIEAAIASFVKERYNWPEVEVAIRQGAPLPDEQIVEVEMLSGTLPGNATFSFRLGSERRIRVTAFVMAYERVVLPKRSLPKGHVLRARDLYHAMMDAARIPAGALSDPQEAIGKTLSRPMLPGMPITHDAVAPVRIVKNGTRVSLLFESPLFAIRTTGVLKQSVVVGRQVKVMNISSKKIVTGLLLDEETVKVGF